MPPGNPAFLTSLRKTLAAILILACGAAAQARDKALAALEAWLRAFRSGQIDLTSLAPLRDGSIARSRNLVPPEWDNVLTPQSECKLLLELASARDDAAAAQTLLAAAALGLSPSRSLQQRGSEALLEMAERALLRLTNRESRETVRSAARGEPPDAAIQAAALRVAGAYGERSWHPDLVPGLLHRDAPVRLAAATGLRRLGAAEAVPALTDLLGRESDGQVLAEVARALERLLELPDTGVRPAHAAIVAVQRALGRTNAEADLALVAVLATHRTPGSVPVLIALFERWPAAGGADERWPAALRRATRDALVALTGIELPPEPRPWREFWEREKRGFRLAGRPERSSHTQAVKFYGLEVTGRRIVFVLDVSGSMAFTDVARGTMAADADLPSRLEVAKRELLAVVARLDDDVEVEVVTFCGSIKVWNGSLVPANAANRRRLRNFIQDLRADGGTDLWGGLSRALDMRSVARGERYTSGPDEIFVLSDGLPTVGEVTSARMLLQLATEANRFCRAKIHTVFIGARPTDRDAVDAAAAGMTGAELMQDLARQNGGKFVTR